MKYTVTQYAKLKGISRQAVWSKINRGIIKAKKDSLIGIWIINTNDNP